MLIGEKPLENILKKRMLEEVEENMTDLMMPKMNVTSSVAKENVNLTLEKLLKGKKEIDRKHMLYILASNTIPDDAYGILFLRKEDARKFNQLNKPTTCDDLTDKK